MQYSEPSLQIMAHTLAGPSLVFSSLFEHSMMVPGNAAGVAKQFLRCIFHQLAPNGIFPQLFQSAIKGNSLPGDPHTTTWPVLGNPTKPDHLLSRWDFFTDLSHISHGLQRAELNRCPQSAPGGRFAWELP